MGAIHDIKLQSKIRRSKIGSQPMANVAPRIGDYAVSEPSINRAGSDPYEKDENPNSSETGSMAAVAAGLRRQRFGT